MLTVDQFLDAVLTCPACGQKHQHSQSEMPGAPNVAGLGPLTDAELNDVSCKARQATPGPWSWFGNTKFHDIYLATVKWGRRYIMGFARWGMRGAQPRFQDPQQHVMVDVSEVAVMERDYRKDFHDINNPDARFIARMDPTTVLPMVQEIRAGRAR